ncbi:DNA polymerase [Paramuricea clavata]|uniref:DNA-directed DNA polymerase n=1 Tax=Paramuricea clavata TaxID=317549 RepID=A0A7D9LKL4_PARCT|nr:DNA polymerase [Paramuricea clavata]
MASSTTSRKRKRNEEDEDEEKQGSPFEISDEQLEDIVRMIRTTRNTRVPAQIFNAELVRVNTRFNHSEYIYNINVSSHNMSTLPELLDNMHRVSQYLINVILNYKAKSSKDKAHFYISKAPKTPFSTAILNVEDFTSQLFFNIFERHMQSNAEERGDQQRMVETRKNTSEAGSARRTVQKHGRETRNGVFQVVAGNVKQNCFQYAILVGKSFLQKDERFKILHSNRNADLMKLYTCDEITNVYETAGVCVGPYGRRSLRYQREKCTVGGYRQYVFENSNENIVNILIDFMLDQPEDSVWIAHNGGRFDSVFLLRELLTKRGIVPKLIMNGNKIMYMEIEQRKIKIIDSYLFLAMRLSKIPEAMENTIGQIPAAGYGGNVNQSVIALCWLNEFEKELEEIGHTLRSKLSPEGEMSLKKISLSDETSRDYSRCDEISFPLCATCAEKQQCTQCKHTDEQRALYGTWTSVEVHKALEHGYKILTIYEIYHFPNSKKNFDLYVDTFMNLKQESSGVPKTCFKPDGELDEVKLRKYIDEYAEHEHVYLDRANISYNPGQRTVMKALLNSLWGKLAQNEDTSIVSSVDSL